MRHTAFDDPAAEPTAQRERVVGARPDVDLLRAPAQQLAVERAGAAEIVGVQLEMHDPAWLARAHGSPASNAGTARVAPRAPADRRPGNATPASAPTAASPAVTPIAGPNPSKKAAGSSIRTPTSSSVSRCSSARFTRPTVPAGGRAATGRARSSTPGCALTDDQPATADCSSAASNARSIASEHSVSSSWSRRSGGSNPLAHH